MHKETIHTRAPARTAIAMLLALATMSGCAPNWTTIAPEVAMLDAYPACKFRKLGSITVKDGENIEERQNRQGGAGTMEVWGASPDERKSLADLRQRALERGGDAVVIRTRLRAEDDTKGTAVRRRAANLTIRAVAIDVEGSVTSPECGVTPIAFER